MATAEKDVTAKYKPAHSQYISFLQQIAKINWLELGDENSRLFHMSIKHRRKQNKINSIQDADGVWIQLVEGVQQAFIKFYSSMFGVKMENRVSVKPIVVDQGLRLSEAHTEMLVCSF